MPRARGSTAGHSQCLEGQGKRLQGRKGKRDQRAEKEKDTKATIGAIKVATDRRAKLSERDSIIMVVMNTQKHWEMSIIIMAIITNGGPRAMASWGI